MADGSYLALDQFRPFKRFRGAHPIDALAVFRQAERLRAAALIVADTTGFALVFAVVLALAAFGVARTGSIPLARTAAAWVSVPIFAGVLVGLYNCGQYSRKAALTGEYNRLFRYSAFAFLAHLLLNLLVFGAPGQSKLQLNLLLLTWIGLPPAATMMRRLARLLLARTEPWAMPTVLVGSPRATETAGAMLRALPMVGLRLVGVEGPAAPSRDGADAGWSAILAQHDARFVVVASEGEVADQAALKSLSRQSVPSLQIIALREAPGGLIERGLKRRDGSDGRGPAGIGPVGRGAKTSVDFFATLAMCLVAAPALIGLAIAVKLDGGPALFRHERVGYRGRTFPCLKFRTMVMNADKVLEDLLARDPAARQEWEATFKLARDPRVTPVGRFLRATSLDELPQLLNVLRGEMSLVGPRPVTPAELPRYGAHVGYYLAAVPGLTGLWQVSGRSDTSYEERVKLDTDYVRNWTLWNDFSILFRTVPAVLLRRGAV